MGNLHQSSNSTTPPLEQTAPFRKLVQHRLTGGFDREDNVEVWEVPGTRQPVVQNREAEDQPTTTVQFTTRPCYVEEDEDEIQQSTRPGTEGAPSHVGAHDPSSDRSPLDEEAHHNERDPIQNILYETASKHRQRGLDEILTLLRNAEQPSNRSSQQKQVITLENRLTALESSLTAESPRFRQ